MHRLTAQQAADLIRERHLSPTDYLEAILARIGAVEDKVRAWSRLDIGDARAQAATLAGEAHAGLIRGPLHGVPIAIKEQFTVGGTGEATAVTRLRAAGAVILGTTIMPHVGQRMPTRNPWNLNRTPGGSSAGSAAAVAARMVPLALGEQTGGSALRPAAYCGVPAFKPTFGRISRRGMSLISYSHDHVGVIGLSIEDIALAFWVLAGPDPLDPTTISVPPPALVRTSEGIASPRVGLVRNFFPERTQPAMRSMVETAAGRLAAAGATLREVDLPQEFGLAWSTYQLTFGAESATLQATEDARAADADTPLTFDARGRGARLLRGMIPATYYLRSQQLRRWLLGMMVDVFRTQEVDVLLTATTPGPAPEGFDDLGDPVLNIPWSNLGLPAITVQSGSLLPEGLPPGLQFAGPPLADAELLRAGIWIEQILGTLQPPAFS